jgi:branched-chain amino acid aminotransferase
VLDSITRRSLLTLARDQLELPVVEREVDRTELYVADELFFVGTGWEILPIVHIDGFTVGDGTMGPVADALDGVYHAVVTGRNRACPDWITPVWHGHERAAADPAEIDVTVPATSRGPSL